VEDAGTCVLKSFFFLGIFFEGCSFSAEKVEDAGTCVLKKKLGKVFFWDACIV
jgi:hypothetical protein